MVYETESLAPACGVDILTAEQARARILDACFNPPEGVDSPTFVYAARSAESAAVVAREVARDLGHPYSVGASFEFRGGARLIVANMDRSETVQGILIDGVVIEDGVAWDCLRAGLIRPDRPRGWVEFAMSDKVRAEGLTMGDPPLPPGQPTTSSTSPADDVQVSAARLARVVNECEERVRSSDGYWSRVTDEIRAEATKEVSRLHEALRDACEENRKLRDQLEAAKSAETAHEAAREALEAAGLPDCATVASGIQQRDRRELEERLRQAGDMPSLHLRLTGGADIHSIDRSECANALDRAIASAIEQIEWWVANGRATVPVESQPRNRRERRDRIIEVIEDAMLKEVNRPDVLEQLSRVHERMREGACAS